MCAVPFRIAGEYDRTPSDTAGPGSGPPDALGRRGWLDPAISLLLPDARRIDHEVDRLRALWRLTFELPKPQIVVSVGWLDHPVARIELHAHLAKIVANQAADGAHRGGVGHVGLIE